MSTSQNKDVASPGTGAAFTAAGSENTEQQQGYALQTFQMFYETNLGPVYRYIFSKVGSREEAEDLTSQVFIKALRGIDLKRDPLSTYKWLFQIARTTIADHWRVYYRTSISSLDELLSAGWEGPVEEQMVDGEGLSAQKVQRLLQALSPNQRDVLTCRFLLNLSIKETALRMGLTEANVKVLQFRALKRAAELEKSVF